MTPPRPPGKDARLLKSAEAARILRIPKWELYRLIGSGLLESYRIGRSIRVPETAVRGPGRTRAPPCRLQTE